MIKQDKIPREIVLRSDFQVIPDVFQLEKIGAGHDGVVFHYGDKVLKVLKYDITKRKEKGLMTFDKAVYFKDELNLKRITQPVDILFDRDGVYTGYAMNYLEDISLDKKKESPIYKRPSDFSCGEFIYSILELEDDFSELTRKNVRANDINRGSYIYTSSFLYLCDMDKYGISSSCFDSNCSTLNFVIAKFIYYEMLKRGNYDKQKLKELSAWVRKSSNSRMFISEVKKEIGSDYTALIGEYVDYKVKRILR